MLDPEERQQLKRKMLVLKILWGFFTVALVAYVVVAHLIGNETVIIGYSNTTLLIIKIVLAVAAFSALVNAYFWRKSMLTAWQKRPKSGFIRQMFTMKTLAPTSSSDAAVKYATATRISIAFAESVGIYGLILFIMSGEFVTLYSFIGVSALALFYLRPKFEDLEQLVINMKRMENSN